MSKNRQNLPPQRDPSGPPTRRAAGPGLGVRVFVSLLLLWHVSAVFVAGLSVPGSSYLAQRVGQHYLQWYLDMLAMNRGHHFFAPNPPPGALIQYRLVDSQGNEIVDEFPKMTEYWFPKTAEHWPRLRYHRHLMLATPPQAGPPDAPPDPHHDNQNAYTYWNRKYLTAYAEHLLRKYDGRRVTIWRVEHFVLDPPMARRPEDREKKLDDASTYQKIEEVTRLREELDSEEQTTELPGANRSAAAGWSSGGRQ